MRATFAGIFLVFAIGWAMAAPQPGLSEQLLGQYYLIQKSLASDSVAGISTPTAQLADISRRAATSATAAKTQLTNLANSAAKLQVTDLKSARNGFGDLSDALVAYLQATQAKRNPPYQFYCPMVKKNWLQPDREIRNPYYGSAMLKCGELIQASQSVEQPMEHNHH
jgi:hypothetical protein